MVMTQQSVIEAAECGHARPEFGRVKDVERLFGIPRSSLYNLLKARVVRGHVLRIRGAKSGIRLFDLDSIRAYIESQRN